MAVYFSTPFPDLLPPSLHTAHLLLQSMELPRWLWLLTVGGVPITILDTMSLGRGIIPFKQNRGE